MIATGFATPRIHALLNDGPSAAACHEKAMQIQPETILHRGAVDLCNQTARASELHAVEPRAFCDGEQLGRRFARMLAPPTAHEQPELLLHRREAALQCAEHARGDAGGVPIHTHDGSERLKPKRMR